MENGNLQSPPAKIKAPKPPKIDEPAPAAAPVVATPAAGLDPSKPIDLKMVRSATLLLDQNDGGKALVVGRAMANGGNIDGTVSRLQQYPTGCVIVTVTKRKRFGDTAVGTDRYITLMGDLEGEVMSDAERKERGFS